MKTKLPNTDIPAYTINNEIYLLNFRTKRTKAAKVYTTCVMFVGGIFLIDLLIMGGRVNPPSVKLGQKYRQLGKALKERSKIIYETIIEGLRGENIYSPLMEFEEAMKGWEINEDELS